MATHAGEQALKLAHSFTRAEETGHYDVIIIGSGLGGLTTASILAKAGKKVLMLEKHGTIGGFTQTFTRKGYEWDAGVHYVGEVNKKFSILRDIFDYVSDGQLKWAEMDEVYDEIIIGDKHYPYRKGKENLKADLIKWFPQEEAAIHKYFELISQVALGQRSYYTDRVFSRWMGSVMGLWTRRKFLKLSDKTTLEVLQSLTKNKDLIAVLSGQYGDYGMGPKDSSFAMHATLTRHYFEGGCYPVGGASSFAKTIGKVILDNGGKMYIRAGVKEIIIREGRAVGVLMEDGRSIYGDAIVSGAGALNTYKNLVPKDELERYGMARDLPQLDSSTAHICLYIGIKESPEALGLGSTNLWLYPHNDHDRALNDFMKDKDAPFPVVYISFPSAKDPKWNEAFPGRSVVEIISCVPYEWFSRWEGERWQKRGEEYEAYKEQLSQRLLSYLYKQRPQLRGKIDYYELSTPLSTKYFTSYEKGEIYGLNHGPKRFRMDFLRARTPIRGLYLTGQDIVTVGIGGALFSGVLTASALLRKNMVKELMKK
ncbi:MAG: NAD(P)/FAD-dependent oxidoreductase [Bacteroidetes bacterium]|nr:NAD(P)/FAD-dependent oxidoreductase [Bacteroidota bacterium]